VSEVDDVLYEIEQATKALKRLNGRSLQDAATANDTSLAIEEMVPVICQEGGSALIPADIFYMPLGAHTTAIGTPPAAWCPYPTTATYDAAQWDATDKRFYVRFSNTVGATGDFGATRIVYPEGIAGKATTYNPKQKDVNTVYIKFRGAFGDNADYTDSGVGATSESSTAANMFTAGRHFIQVLRNAGNWELGTGDGTNASQTTGGTADASLHYFTIRWTLAEVRLLVDDAVVVTKTTNLPTEPLALSLRSASDSYTIDLVDFYVGWEQE
jgi:hypothetical protein